MRRGRLAPLRARTQSAAGVEQTLASKYMADHRVSDLLHDVLNDLVLLQPPDALKFLHDRLGQMRGVAPQDAQDAPPAGAYSMRVHVECIGANGSARRRALRIAKASDFEDGVRANWASIAQESVQEAVKEAFGEATAQEKPGSDDTFLLTGSLLSVGVEVEQAQDERVVRRKDALAAVSASVISDIEEELLSLAAGAANRRRLGMGGGGRGPPSPEGSPVGGVGAGGKGLGGGQGERRDLGIEMLVAKRIVKECRERVDAMMADEPRELSTYEENLGHVVLLRSLATAKWQYFLTVPGLGFSDLDAVSMERAADHMRHSAANAYALEGTHAVAADLAVATGLVAGLRALDRVSVGSGDSPLCRAAGGGDVAHIQVLLDANCAVDTPNRMRELPLSVAAGCGHQDAVALLLRCSANVWAQSGPFHERPLVSACRHGHVKVMEQLWQHAASSNPPGLADGAGAWWETSGDAAQCLIAAGRHGHVEVLRRLCDLMGATGGAAPEGVSVLRDAADKDGRNVLAVAATNGLGHVIQFVCETLAEDHLLSSLHAADSKGRTSLMIAAERGHVTCADQLSMAGGSELLLRTTEKGWNCLHKAAQFGHVAVVRLLAERGGSELLMTADLRGWTSLHVASFWGQAQVVDILLARGGAKLCCLHNVSGNTALWGAVTNGHRGIVERLCDLGGPQVLGDVPALRRALAAACAKGFKDVASAVEMRFKECLDQPDQN